MGGCNSISEPDPIAEEYFWTSRIAMKLTTRIFGLLLAAVAVQFMLNALDVLRGGVLLPQ